LDRRSYRFAHRDGTRIVLVNGHVLHVVVESFVNHFHQADRLRRDLLGASHRSGADLCASIADRLENNGREVADFGRKLLHRR